MASLYSPASSSSSSASLLCLRRPRREITPQEKAAYMKAFIVWVCFTAGGWLSIPNEYLPLFSHCVGFGFFLVMVTKQTRWLLALSIGALVFSSLTHNLLPRSWIAITSNSVGYGAFIVFLILVLCCVRVRTKPLKVEEKEKEKEKLKDNELMSLDSMSETLSRAALHAMHAVSDTYTAIPNTNEIFEEMRKSMFNLQTLMERAKEQSYSTYKDMQTFMGIFGSKLNEQSGSSISPNAIPSPSAAGASAVQSDADNDNDNDNRNHHDNDNDNDNENENGSEQQNASKSGPRKRSAQKAKNRKKSKADRSNNQQHEEEHKSNEEHDDLQAAQKRRRRRNKNKKSNANPMISLPEEPQHVQSHSSQSEDNESEHDDKDKLFSANSSAPLSSTQGSNHMNCAHCTANSYHSLSRDELLATIHLLHSKLTTAEKEMQWMMNELATKSASIEAHIKLNEAERKYEEEKSTAEKSSAAVSAEPRRLSPSAMTMLSGPSSSSSSSSAASVSAPSRNKSPPQRPLSPASASPRLNAASASSLEAHRRVVDNELDRLTRELKEMMAIQTKMQQHMRQLDANTIHNLHPNMHHAFHSGNAAHGLPPMPMPMPIATHAGQNLMSNISTTAVSSHDSFSLPQSQFIAQQPRSAYSSVSAHASSTSSSATTSAPLSSSSGHVWPREGHSVCGCSEGSQHRADCPILSISNSSGVHSNAVAPAVSLHPSFPPYVHSAFRPSNAAVGVGAVFQSASAAAAASQLQGVSDHGRAAVSVVHQVRSSSSSQSGEEGGEPGSGSSANTSGSTHRGQHGSTS